MNISNNRCATSFNHIQVTCLPINTSEHEKHYMPPLFVQTVEFLMITKIFQGYGQETSTSISRTTQGSPQPIWELSNTRQSQPIWEWVVFNHQPPILCLSKCSQERKPWICALYEVFPQSILYIENEYSAKVCSTRYTHCCLTLTTAIKWESFKSESEKVKVTVKLQKK